MIPVLLVLLLPALTPVALADGSAADGAALAWKYHCGTCHGQAGKAGSQRYPNIAGQNSAYISARLKYFRSQTEPGNKMNAQAAPLDDTDIATLANYYSRMPAAAGTSSGTAMQAGLVNAKGCVACHGPDGAATSPAYPNLKGQWTRYLRLQLMAYRSGKRQNAIMNGFAATLSDQEIRALAAYYGTE